MAWMTTSFYSTHAMALNGEFLSLIKLFCTNLKLHDSLWLNNEVDSTKFKQRNWKGECLRTSMKSSKSVQLNMASKQIVRAGAGIICEHLQTIHPRNWNKTFQCSRCVFARDQFEWIILNGQLYSTKVETLLTSFNVQFGWIPWSNTSLERAPCLQFYWNNHAVQIKVDRVNSP